MWASKKKKKNLNESRDFPNYNYLSSIFHSSIKSSAIKLLFSRIHYKRILLLMYADVCEMYKKGKSDCYILSSIQINCGNYLEFFYLQLRFTILYLIKIIIK